jgi:electron transfer flavoprotein beta subunit
MNRYDESAVEEALRIKESFSDTIVDIISVGPPHSETIVKRAIGMGADKGIHIVTETRDYIDPFLVASWISTLAGKGKYDLILTGAMSEDAMHGLVGPLIAENLTLPCATVVIFQRLLPETNRIYVEREIEGGFREQLELMLPAVLAIQTGINTPRYPSLSNLMRANKMELEAFEAANLQKPLHRQEIVGMGYPEKSRAGIFLKGSQDQKAAQLIKILHEKSFIQHQAPAINAKNCRSPKR